MINDEKVNHQLEKYLSSHGKRGNIKRLKLVKVVGRMKKLLLLKVAGSKNDAKLLIRITSHTTESADVNESQMML